MVDITISPTTPVTGGAIVSATNPMPVTIIGGLSAAAVTSVSFGTTGLTPATPTAGDVVVSGTLSATNGGTGRTSLGTGVAAALGVNTGSAGAMVLLNGAGGTPTSLTLTNATGLPVAGGGTGSTTGQGAMTALSGVYVLAVSNVSASTVGTTEATGIQIAVNVPAGAMGQFGVLEFEAFLDNKSSLCAMNITSRFAAGSGVGTTGTQIIGLNLATNVTQLLHQRLANYGGTSAQIGNVSLTPYSAASNAYATAAIDTTAATVYRINLCVLGGNGTTDRAAVRGYQCKLITGVGT